MSNLLMTFDSDCNAVFSVTDSVSSNSTSVVASAPTVYQYLSATGLIGVTDTLHVTDIAKVASINSYLNSKMSSIIAKTNHVTNSIQSFEEIDTVIYNMLSADYVAAYNAAVYLQADNMSIIALSHTELIRFHKEVITPWITYQAGFNGESDDTEMKSTREVMQSVNSSISIKSEIKPFTIGGDGISKIKLAEMFIMLTQQLLQEYSVNRRSSNEYYNTTTSQ